MVFRWAGTVFKGSWELFRVHPHLRIFDHQVRKKCQIDTSYSSVVGRMKACKGAEAIPGLVSVYTPRVHYTLPALSSL